MGFVNATAARSRGDRRAWNEFLFSGTALRGRLGIAILALSGIALTSGTALALDVNALPQGGQVTSGSATITQTAPAQLGIAQHSDRAILDWNSFNIGANAGVNFQQPSSSAIAVNRVGGGTDPSQILGTLTANGQVMILNPNGVLFGHGAHVDVAGLVASTGNIDDAAFMRGDTRLTLSSRTSGASVVNQGAITARDGGLVAFVAPSVANDGLIEARVGHVALAGASKVTLDLYGDQMIQIAVDGGSQAAGVLVANSGRIAADGGRVLLTAEAARNYVDQVINTSGVVRAQGVSVDGGAIVLDGGSNGTVTVAGTLDASTAQAGGTGGTIKVVGDRTTLTDTAVLTASGDIQGGQIETSGHTLSIAAGARVDTDAANGQGGNWLLDPTAVNIATGGGSDLTAPAVDPNAIVSALNSGSVTIQADDSITVSNDVDSSAQANANTLTFKDGNTDNNLTVNLNAKVNLGASQHLTGEGTTVNVGSNGKIQNGVDVAASGATVNVAAGTYAETLSLAKAVTLRGANVGKDPNHATRAAESMITGPTTISGSGQVVIDGFEFFDNSVNSNYKAISVVNLAGSPEIRNSIFDRTGASAGTTSASNQRGISISPSNVGGITVENNLFTSDMADPATDVWANIGWKSAIWSDGGTNATVIQNNVIENSRTAINLDDFTNSIHVTGNTLRDNGSGMSFGGATPTNGSFSISGNDFSNLDTDINLSNVASTFRLDATANTFNGKAVSALSQDELFALEDRIVHGLDSGKNGLVTVKADNLYVTQSSGSIQRGVDYATAGDTVNVGAGTYNDPNVNINKNNLTLAGATGAKIVVPDFAGQRNGININADGATVSGFEIAGPVTSSFLTYAWGSNISRGIAVSNGSDNFTIKNNNIHDVRNGILIDGRNAASTVTGNTIENTKGAISVQYTDGSTIDISGNSEGPIGNEWGVNLHLNGHLAGDGTTILSNSTPIASAPDSTWQQALLTQSAANGGWSIQDQGYTSSNRTEVTVATTGSATNQGSALNPLNSIQNGVNAVVAGGTVNVKAGTYAESVTVNKGLTIDGAGIGQTTLEAASHWSGNAFTVNGASNVTLSDLTVSDYQYGLNISGTSNDMNVTRVAFDGNRYGVRTATTAKVDRFHMTDSSFADGEIAVQTYNNSANAGSFADALFDGVTVDDFTYKGFYFETANNLRLNDVTITDTGNVGGLDPSQLHQYGHAIDFNLKYGAYDTLALNDVVIENSGHSSGDATRAAIAVKTRGTPGDSATYTAHPASLRSLTITGGRIENSDGTAIRFENLSNGAGGSPTLTVSTSFANNGTDIQTDRVNVNATGSTFTGATTDAQVEARLLHAADDSARGRVTWTLLDPPSSTPEDFLPPEVEIVDALPPPPPAPPPAPPPQVTPPPPADVVSTVPPALLLTIVTPAAGNIPSGGGSSPPQVVVTNNTSGVGGALAGGSAVVLDMSGTGPAYTQTTGLTSALSGGSTTLSGGNSQSGGSNSQSGGSSNGSSTPQNQPGSGTSSANDGSEQTE